jgi:hypothetical protein
LPLVYLNAVGGQDELVFDGASFALNKSGELALSLPHFKECLSLIEFKQDSAIKDLVKNTISPATSMEAQVYDALVLGVKDYLNKNGFPGAIKSANSNPAIAASAADENAKSERPTCAAATCLAGSLMSFLTRWARRLPSLISCSIRDARTVISAVSPNV